MIKVEDIAFVRFRAPDLAAMRGSPALGVDLGRQLRAMLLSGLRVPEAEADPIAAQASEEIIRAGTFRTEFGGATGRRQP